MICNGHDIIRAGYAAGTPVRDIAAQCGSTPGSVKVIAHRLGIKHARLVYPRVPAADRASFRYLTMVSKLPASEAARMLGVQL